MMTARMDRSVWQLSRASIPAAYTCGDKVFRVAGSLKVNTSAAPSRDDNKLDGIGFSEW